MPSWALSRLLFLAAALHGCEASGVAQGSFLEFRSACASAVWSRKMPLAHNGTVLSLLDGPVGCDPGFLCYLEQFRLMRFLAYRSGDVLGTCG